LSIHQHFILTRIVTKLSFFLVFCFAIKHFRTENLESATAKIFQITQNALRFIQKIAATRNIAEIAAATGSIPSERNIYVF